MYKHRNSNSNGSAATYCYGYTGIADHLQRIVGFNNCKRCFDLFVESINRTEQYYRSYSNCIANYNNHLYYYRHSS